MYTELLHIMCSNSKKSDDEIKLRREILNGTSYISALCRLISNQFSIVGIQIASITIYLNILVNDLTGIPRYFHLDYAEIPLFSH